MPVRPAVPPALKRRPFLARAAIGDGLLTAAQLRGQNWRRVFRGVYVNASVPDTHLSRVEAAALLLPPGAAVTGRSAALWWGAKMGSIDGPVEVLTPARFGPVAGLAIRTGALPGEAVTVRWGLPVCTALRTAWELARVLPAIEAVGWIDALARGRGLRRTHLTAESLRHIGEMGSIRAAETLSLCDPRAESPPESHLRVHLARGGLPRPVPQFSVLVDGLFVARVDLAWPALRFAIEYDGQWHVDPAQLADDRSRLRALHAAGWHVFHVTRTDMRDIPRLLRDLNEALDRRRRDLTGRRA